MIILGGYTADSIITIDVNSYDSDAFTPIIFASLAVTVDINRSGTKYTLPTPYIGSTDTSVANRRFAYSISGTGYTKAAVAAGTALGTGTILSDDWGLYVGNINAAGTIVFTAAAGNFDGSYATEAAALGALAATVAGLAATQHAFGYLTVQTNSGNPFIGNTDALQGGASGNPSDDTNYYNFGAGDATNSNGVIVVTEDQQAGTGSNIVGYAEAVIDNSGGELGFAEGDDVNVRVIAGTVDAISRIGTVLARFSISPDGLTTQQKADVEAEATDAIEAASLDHLVAVADADDVADDSIMGKLASTDGDWSNFSETTDSLQSVRDHATTIKSETALIVGDTNELQTDNVPGLIDALPTAVENRTEMDSNSTQLALLSNPAGIKKNTALEDISWPMRDADGDLVTGATVSGLIQKDGGAFNAIAGTIAQVASNPGMYQVTTSPALTAAELNADQVCLIFTATGAKPTIMEIYTEP